ncbi:MAG: glycosyltransferase [Flavobacteriales bacterium]|nr:glycosyltransferase [Flavobacteriales bacterium]
MQQILQWETWLLATVAVFVAAWLTQIIYLLQFFRSIAMKPIKTISDPTEWEPVSVIVCARNEEKNLRENIPAIMDQDYPNFEVIVVNDSSWDDTEAILTAFHVHFPNLRIVTLDEEKQNLQGKKFALTLGIKAAKNKILLLTDADCVPASRNWIRDMVRPLQEDTEIVIGFSPYLQYPGWLNRIIRFDTLMIGLSYMGLAKAGKPYMGIGRNLCYTRDLFFKVGGFKRHYNLSSGDDDLFINEVADSRNTEIVFDPESQTESEPKKTWTTWFAQKKRHLTTSPRYKSLHKSLLAIWPFSYVLMLTSFGLCVGFQTGMLLVSSMLFVRYVLQIAILHGSSKNLAQGKDLVWLAPILELHLLFLNVGLYFSNLVRRPQKWN